MRQTILAALALLVLSTRVSAQSNVAMEDSIPEIVVTGTGTEHYLKDAPVQTEVIPYLDQRKTYERGYRRAE